MASTTYTDYPDGIGCSCKGKKKLASLMPKSHLKHYSATHVYIFDYDDKDTRICMDKRDERSHKTACSKMHSFYTQYVKCTVHTVAHNTPGMRGKDFLKWWMTELSKYDRNVLVIVYFNGNASISGRGITYRWRFFSKPRRLSAHKLFLATNNCKPDCVWMLDCPFPTRYRDAPHRVRGASDYTIAGHSMDYNRADADNNQLQWDYTSRMATFLPYWVKGLKTTFRDHHKRLSIPEIMSYDTEMCSNLLRFWERKTSRGSIRDVYRICIEPDKVRARGRIEFVRVRTQGLHKTDKQGFPKDNDNSDSEDGPFEDSADEMLSDSEEDEAKSESEHEQSPEPGFDTDNDPASGNGGEGIEIKLEREPIDLLAGAKYTNLTDDNEELLINPTDEELWDIKMEHFGELPEGETLFV